MTKSKSVYDFVRDFPLKWSGEVIFFISAILEKSEWGKKSKYNFYQIKYIQRRKKTRHLLTFSIK